MKNMLINGAMAFRPPEIAAKTRVTRAMVAVIARAWRGSPLSDSRARNLLRGKMPCWASACITRGAATMEARAEEKVAPSRPATTSCGQ